MSNKHKAILPKLIQSLGKLLLIIGSLLLTFKFTYLEWQIISENFLNLFNPFIHYQILIGMLVSLDTWVLFLISIMGISIMSISKEGQ